MLSKSALLHVTEYARHGNHRSSSILYLSNRLFLVCFEILLKLQDKRVCRYLDVLIHSTVRRNKLTQSKIRWSQKREGGQKWKLFTWTVECYFQFCVCVSFVLFRWGKCYRCKSEGSSGRNRESFLGAAAAGECLFKHVSITASVIFRFVVR